MNAEVDRATTLAPMQPSAEMSQGYPFSIKGPPKDESTEQKISDTVLAFGTSEASIPERSPRVIPPDDAVYFLYDKEFQEFAQTYIGKDALKAYCVKKGIPPPILKPFPPRKIYRLPAEDRVSMTVATSDSTPQPIFDHEQSLKDDKEALETSSLQVSKTLRERKQKAEEATRRKRRKMRQRLARGALMLSLLLAGGIGGIVAQKHADKTQDVTTSENSDNAYPLSDDDAQILQEAMEATETGIAIPIRQDGLVSYVPPSIFRELAASSESKTVNVYILSASEEENMKITKVMSIAQGEELPTYMSDLVRITETGKYAITWYPETVDEGTSLLVYDGEIVVVNENGEIIDMIIDPTKIKNDDTPIYHHMMKYADGEFIEVSAGQREENAPGTFKDVFSDIDSIYSMFEPFTSQRIILRQLPHGNNGILYEVDGEKVVIHAGIVNLDAKARRDMLNKAFSIAVFEAAKEEDKDIDAHAAYKEFHEIMQNADPNIFKIIDAINATPEEDRLMHDGQSLPDEADVFAAVIKALRYNPSAIADYLTEKTYIDICKQSQGNPEYQMSNDAQKAELSALLIAGYEVFKATSYTTDLEAVFPQYSQLLIYIKYTASDTLNYTTPVPTPTATPTPFGLTATPVPTADTRTATPVPTATPSPTPNPACLYLTPTKAPPTAAAFLDPARVDKTATPIPTPTPWQTATPASTETPTDIPTGSLILH